FPLPANVTLVQSAELSGTGDHDLWVGFDSGIIAHWDGSMWTSYMLNANVYHINASSSGVFAIVQTSMTKLVSFNQNMFEDVSLLNGPDAIWQSSDGAAFVSVSDVNLATPAVIVRPPNETTWIELPVDPHGIVRSIGGTTSHDVWLGISGSDGNAYV